MSKEAITKVLNESRNGMNAAIRYNPFTPNFLISDGVNELATAGGCYWLLDILATEVAPKLMVSLNKGDIASAICSISVTGAAAKISVTVTDDAPAYWTRELAFTDWPEGEWTLFELGGYQWSESGVRNIIATLLSEH